MRRRRRPRRRRCTRRSPEPAADADLVHVAGRIWPRRPPTGPLLCTLPRRELAAFDTHLAAQKEAADRQTAALGARSDRFVCSSQFIRSELTRLFGADAARVDVVPLTAEADARRLTDASVALSAERTRCPERFVLWPRRQPRPQELPGARRRARPAHGQAGRGRDRRGHGCGHRQPSTAPTWSVSATSPAASWPCSTISPRGWCRRPSTRRVAFRCGRRCSRDSQWPARPSRRCSSSSSAGDDGRDRSIRRPRGGRRGAGRASSTGRMITAALERNRQIVAGRRSATSPSGYLDVFESVAGVDAPMTKDEAFLGKPQRRRRGRHDLRRRAAAPARGDRVGEGSRIDDFTRIEGGQGVEIGRHVHISWFCSIFAGGRALVGDYSCMAQGSRILTGLGAARRGDELGRARPSGARSRRATSILDHLAFLGTNSVMMPGTVVGVGAVARCRLGA